MHITFNQMKELIKILQLVIPTEKYSLCLVNPQKIDVHEVYITYSGHAVENTIYYVFEPVNLETEILYAESYAILEEYNSSDLDSTFHYEVLYVADGVIYLQKFYRKCLENATLIDKHPLFHSSIWEIQETSIEYIPLDELITVICKERYSKKVPKNNSIYRHFVLKSELFEQFFEDLYSDMMNYLNGDKRNADEKWDFGDLLFSVYGVELENIEGTEIVLSKCTALMKKLNISKYEMAEYYIKYFAD